MHQQPGQDQNDHGSIIFSPKARSGRSKSIQDNGFAGAAAAAAAAAAANSSQTGSRKDTPGCGKRSLDAHRHVSQAQSSRSDSPAAQEDSANSQSHEPLFMELTDSASDADLEDTIDKIAERLVDSGRHKSSWCYRHASDHPPITMSSLEELDMPRIINNPKLRHDVNFDRDLHFRPNLDGCKGKQKMMQADQYWEALRVEFSLYTLLLQRATQPNLQLCWERVMRKVLRRLPNVFRAVRDILKTLVPDHDQPAVNERLDVSHLLQQVRHGVCDLVDLSNWLAKVLKNHCAPMRDGLVDSMQKTITQGAVEGREDKLALGLRSLLNILEAMKLDVANHQIRHMRPLLIEDTINFQRRYNGHRVDAHKIDGVKAKSWLQQEIHRTGLMPINALISATVRDLLTVTSPWSMPQSFYLDLDRLRALRVEIQSAVGLDMCRQVLKALLRPNLSEQQYASAYQMLQAAVPAIVGSSGKFYERFEYLAVEIVRIVLEIEQRESPLDMAMLNAAEKMLAECLRPSSSKFQAGLRAVGGRLTVKVQGCVHDSIKLAPLALLDTLIPSSTPSRPPPVSAFGAVCAPAPSISRREPRDADDDVVRRLTHILVLHWQVWGELVYLKPNANYDSSSDESDADESDSMSEIVPSAAGSPSISVSTDSFGSGHALLPQAIITVEALPSPLSSPISSQTDLKLPISSENALTDLMPAISVAQSDAMDTSVPEFAAIEDSVLVAPIAQQPSTEGATDTSNGNDMQCDSMHQAQ